MRWLIPVVLMACGHGATNDPDLRSSGVASVGGAVPTPTGNRVDPLAPPAPPSTSDDPNDHDASATALLAGRNYVAPAELAYSKKLRSVIYPACGGGEGPGEHCSLGGFDSAGASFNLDAAYQVAWTSYPGTGGGDDRAAAHDKLVAALDALETTRLERRPWTGTTPLVLPDYGTLSWDPAAKKLIATRESATSKVGVQWSDRGGPVNIFWSPGVPLAVVQLRVNPGSGGRESSPPQQGQPGMQTEHSRNEGYVVFIQLVVVPRP